ALPELVTIIGAERGACRSRCQVGDGTPARRKPDVAGLGRNPSSLFATVNVGHRTLDHDW
ncbi:MAG: hypothetical protein ACE5I9_12215, partial [Candidatus Methylomirabilales bacterium]